MGLVSALSNLLFQIFQCVLGGIFWLSRLVLLVGLSKSGFVLVASFCWPEIGICISLLVMWLVLWLEFLVVGCCMAYVVMYSIGCSVGRYACSLCTVWVLSPLASLLVCPISFWYLLVIILHGCLFIFFFLVLHGVCVMGIVGNALVGGLILLFMYHHLFMCCLWSLCYIFLHFFLFYVLYAHFFIHLFPSVFLLAFCVFFSCLDENFWGVWVHMYYMQPYMCLNWVYLTYFPIADTISQDSKVRHVIL